MGESIEFPLNFERFMAIGREALVAEEFVEAELNFTKAYDMKADLEANRLLVESLLGQSKVLDALAIASEMQGDYLAKDETLTIYLRLLIGTGKFIQSRKLVNQLSQQAQRQAVKLEIEQSEQLFRLYQQPALRELKQQSREIATGNFMQQATRLKSWGQLPLAEYLVACCEAIEGGELPLILRNSLLADLVELKSEEPVTIIPLTGESRSVIPNTLPLIEEQTSYQAACQALASLVENPDSELHQQLKEELRLHFVMLYPQADDLVSEPQLWVELFLATYLGSESVEEVESNQRVADYQELQAQITIILSGMFM